MSLASKKERKKTRHEAAVQVIDRILRFTIKNANQKDTTMEFYQTLFNTYYSEPLPPYLYRFLQQFGITAEKTVHTHWLCLLVKIQDLQATIQKIIKFYALRIVGIKREISFYIPFAITKNKDLRFLFEQYCFQIMKKDRFDEIMLKSIDCPRRPKTYF